MLKLVHILQSYKKNKYMNDIMKRWPCNAKIFPKAVILKKCDRNIDCGYILEQPRQGGS